MLMPAAAVAGVAFDAAGLVGAERGCAGVLRLVRVCAWAVNGSATASVMRSIVLKSKMITFLYGESSRFMLCMTVINHRASSFVITKFNKPFLSGIS